MAPPASTIATIRGLKQGVSEFYKAFDLLKAEYSTVKQFYWYLATWELNIIVKGTKSGGYWSRGCKLSQ